MPKRWKIFAVANYAALVLYSFFIDPGVRFRCALVQVRRALTQVRRALVQARQALAQVRRALPQG